MEITPLTALLYDISSFLHLSSYNKSSSQSSDLNQNYYQKAEEVLKLLKLILDAIFDTEVISEEDLNKTFLRLSQSVDELRELFQSWQPFSSKANFVFRNESLLSKIRTSGQDCIQFLKSSGQHLPDGLSLSSLEHCMAKLKDTGREQTLSVITEAIRDQVDSIGPSSKTLVKIADLLCLKSNQEILIEAVALEKLKEIAELAEKASEVEFIDQMISLVTHMHDRLVLIKQSETSSPVPIPPDFCCPLSLELMTDPVIVASGQTYERVFIKNWIDLGLTVCPKTRQSLAHTTLIPNFTVKALIANWCDTNNVKLPDPKKSINLNQALPLLVHSESGSPNVFPLSRSNQQMSLEFRSTSSAGKDMILSSSDHREGSPLHPRSTSEVPESGAMVNGSDSGRISVARSGERPSSSTNRSAGSVVHHSAPLCRLDVDASLPQGHTRRASASGPPNDVNFPRRAMTGANMSSELSNHISSYSSDASGEVKAETHTTIASNAGHREPEFLPQLIETRSRSQSMFRRPSDRPVPRTVSSPATETRTDLSEVETQVRKLVENLQSPSIDAQRAATADLRLLAKHNMDNRIIIANCGAIGLLVNLLSSEDTKIQEDAVTTLLNLSINDNNKSAIASADAIEPLIHVLKTGTPEAKENSAATLFSLSVIEENKVKIGRSGAIQPLVDLLGNGTHRGKKDAATALFNLSISSENKAPIVQAGAVKHLIELMDPAAGMVDKAVAVLANLATTPEGRTQIGQENGIPVLVEAVELGSARGKENAAAALLQLCLDSPRCCNMVLQEGAVPPLVALSQYGTPRAKEKAQHLLSCFRNQRHGNGGRG